MAQTPEVPVHPPHHKVPDRKLGDHKAPVKLTHSASHGTPVVTPRHGATPRKPVHSKAALVTPTYKDIKEKPAPKPLPSNSRPKTRGARQTAHPGGSGHRYRAAFAALRQREDR